MVAQLEAVLFMPTLALCLTHTFATLQNFRTKYEIRKSFLDFGLFKKIPHMGNIGHSCMNVIQEYRFYIMSVSQYHRCCQYHESMSIPWVHVDTRSPCLWHEPFPVTRVIVHTISPELFITEIQKNLQNTNYKNSEIMIIEIQKYPTSISGIYMLNRQIIRKKKKKNY